MHLTDTHLEIYLKYLKKHKISPSENVFHNDFGYDMVFGWMVHDIITKAKRTKTTKKRQKELNSEAYKKILLSLLVKSTIDYALTASNRSEDLIFLESVRYSEDTSTVLMKLTLQAMSDSSFANVVHKGMSNAYITQCLECGIESHPVIIALVTN